MSRINVIFAVEGIILAAFLFWAGTASHRAFYEAHVNQRIERCEQVVSLIESNADERASVNLDVLEELRFFRDNKEELIKVMCEKQIKPDEHEIGVFLSKMRHDSYRGQNIYASY